MASQRVIFQNDMGSNPLFLLNILKFQVFPKEMPRSSSFWPPWQHATPQQCILLGVSSPESPKSAYFWAPPGQKASEIPISGHLQQETPQKPPLLGEF